MSETCEHCGGTFSSRGIKNHTEACRKQHENGREQETHDTRIDSNIVENEPEETPELGHKSDVVDRLSGVDKTDKTHDASADNKESGSRLWTWAVGIGSGLAILAGFALGGKVK